MSYHNIKNQYRSNRNKEHTVKIIIYIVLIAAIVIFWFLSAKSVHSLQEQLSKDSQAQTQSIEENFKQKLTLSDKSAIELGILGEDISQKGYPEFGILILAQAIQKDNTIRDLNLYTAKLYFDLGDYEQARTTALLAEKADPIYAPTYELLSGIYQALGDEENANICYNKASDFSTDK